MKLFNAARSLWRDGMSKTVQSTLAVTVLVVLSIQYSDRLGLLWAWYKLNRDSVVPLATGIGGVVALSVAFGQFRTARLRHEEQTRADFRRRITESFTKATEQLGSDKMEVRLGGIYTLERIWEESPSDYTVAMETLTAFLRERARWMAPDSEDDPIFQPAHPRTHCPTDVQAALTVIGRCDRPEGARAINLSFTNLESAFIGGDFHSVLFEGANLRQASLPRSRYDFSEFTGADLSGAKMVDSSFKRAAFSDAIARNAFFVQCVLEASDFSNADLTNTFFVMGTLRNANFSKANVSKARFVKIAIGEDQLTTAFGDTATELPEGLKRPDSWIS